jgi:hypothetical protein
MLTAVFRARYRSVPGSSCLSTKRVRCSVEAMPTTTKSYGGISQARDIARRPDQGPSRWIIDFGTRSLEEAGQYPAALQIVRDRVKPAREGNRRELYRRVWWLFGEPRPGMRHALGGRTRYCAGTATGKRLLLAWQTSVVCPSNLNNVFVLHQDCTMGILLARMHGAWARNQSSTLKGDLRYTPTPVFDTFPWPDPTTPEQRERVADVCRRLLARRTEICTSEQIGLTKLYNAVDDGAYADLTALHRELDEAVADCYGWPRSIAQDDAELVRRLTERNREIAEGSRPYDPFGRLSNPSTAPPGWVGFTWPCKSSGRSQPVAASRRGPPYPTSRRDHADGRR